MKNTNGHHAQCCFHDFVVLFFNIVNVPTLSRIIPSNECVRLKDVVSVSKMNTVERREEFAFINILYFSHRALNKIEEEIVEVTCIKLSFFYRNAFGTCSTFCKLTYHTVSLFYFSLYSNMQIHYGKVNPIRFHTP